eukprot:SAG31_NODE_29712_length_391_cov_0.691781_1_plen_75_part_01
MNLPDVASWAKDGILTSTVMPWRDQTWVAKYFRQPNHSGSDPYGWVWELRTSASLIHRVTKQTLDFSFRVAGNGT